MAATVKAGKRAAIKPPQRAQEPAASVSGDTDFEVPRLTTCTDREEERVTLFYLDDVPYSVAKRPGVNVGLQYLHLTRTQGETQAIDYLLGKMLGEEGYRALREYDDLTPEQFEQITEIAGRLALGALETPKG